MTGFLFLLAAGLVMLSQVNAEPSLSRTFIENAVKDAKIKVDNDYEYSRRETVARVRRNAANPSDILRLLKQPVGVTRTAVRSADYMDASIRLIQKRSLTSHHIQKRSINATDLISEEDLMFIADLTGCSARARPPSCKTTPNLNTFRTYTSVCNNRNNPRQGSSNIPFNRWLPAEYQDGISLPSGWDPARRINRRLLPLVREVSNSILATANEDAESDTLYTNLVVMFGQWTDHDLTLTPHSPVIRSFNDGIDCDQTCDRTEPCFPILIPETDPRFGNNSKECIPFFRSSAACGSGNTGHFFGGSTVREQMNSLTAFIDVGQVYGADDTKAQSLRNLTTDKGLMRVNTQFDDNGREFLPFSKMSANMCATRRRITNDSNAQEVPCFVAGDERSNENIGLTAMHTLMLREHNRLARALAILNPKWSGERIYQEARKIMGGYMQVITFRDYLLHIVGPDFVSRQLSNYPGYNESVDPSIANVFATAAYRFAHLMIQPFIFRLNETYEEHPDFPSPLLYRAFFTPWRAVFEGGLDPILRGLAGRKAKLNTQDHMMVDELRERLFEFSSHLALDLGALNLQRSRDHGIPGYNKWRGFCGLSQPRNRIQLARVLRNSRLADALLDLYGTPDNIDVWMGGVSEPFVRGGRTGPLFACIISTQFQRIREGDRLWWQNPGVFTQNQRVSLRNTSLARIICDNTGITEVPNKPFLYRPRGSGYTNCTDIPAFDLSPWQEGPNGFPEDTLVGPAGPQGPRGERGATGPAGRSELVAFSLRLGNNFPTAGVPIPFKQVIYNAQSVYDTNTGQFTCVIPGVYEFDFHCTISENSGNVDLMLNRNVVVHSFTTAAETGLVSASGGTLLQLSEGDKVYLLANHGGNGLTADSYFSGHLL